MFYICRMIFAVLIEIFDLFKTEFIYSSIIFVCPNDPVGQREVVVIPIFEIVLTYYNDK